MKVFQVLLFLSFLSISLSYSIWPQPQVFTRGTVQVTLNPTTFQFITSSSSALLKSAIARYQVSTFPFPATTTVPNVAVLPSVTIIVATTNETLQLGVNENYTLSVTSTGATIQAPTVFGAMRGLESFAQLVDFDYSNKTYSIQETPISINDYPRFPWRGLMIDTGRHFLQVQTILTMIDAVAYNKMNTLHWHAVDSQSFPIQSATYPNLAKAGSYSFPEATYTAEDIKTVVYYGYERGVRVVPEFDVPGHTYTWGLGYPGITLNCTVPDWGTGGVTLDITNPQTYELLDGFFAEMRDLFMDEHIHFGSDEVQYACWNITSVLDWMKVNGFTTFNEVMQYFEDNLLKITTKNGINNRIFWEDEFIDNNINFDSATSMFEIWIDKSSLVPITKAGYKAILANGFYLDIQQPGPTVHYEWVDTWTDFYTNEPFSGAAANLTYAERQLVLGGEACMWGEAVEDENIFSRVWVRASGAAEKLWSSMDFTTNPDFDAAQTRLIEFRCRLKRRGIHATAIRPDYCPSLL